MKRIPREWPIHIILANNIRLSHTVSSHSHTLTRDLIRLNFNFNSLKISAIKTSWLTLLEVTDTVKATTIYRQTYESEDAATVPRTP